MAETGDSYQTIKGEAQSQFTEQRSRFISFAWHVTHVDQVKEHVAAVQKEYYDARHVCYAYMLGPERLEWRANDNGEPSGTAGKPILGQINSAGLTDILIVVVRYFGGVKLGTSGLIEAYRRAATDAIQASTVITLYVQKDIAVLARYDSVNEVMRAVKDMDLTIAAQEYGMFQASDHETSVAACPKSPYDCRFLLRMRAGNVTQFKERIARLTESQKDPYLCIQE